VAVCPSKKKQLWIITAVEHCTGRTLAGVLGGREAATFQRLSDKVKHLADCIVYTDHWDTCAQGFPTARQILGKAYTHAIERDTSHTRPHRARMTRKTKVVSKSEAMLDASLKLWCALNVPAIFKRLSIRLVIFCTC
jgi:insertion element IS1 protein InsB